MQIDKNFIKEKSLEDELINTQLNYEKLKKLESYSLGFKTIHNYLRDIGSKNDFDYALGISSYIYYSLCDSLNIKNWEDMYYDISKKLFVDDEIISKLCYMNKKIVFFVPSKIKDYEEDFNYGFNLRITTKEIIDYINNPLLAKNTLFVFGSNEVLKEEFSKDKTKFLISYLNNSYNFESLLNFIIS
jgi:hypothetical protein